MRHERRLPDPHLSEPTHPSVMNPIKVGLLGIGTVGSGTFKVLQTAGFRT